MLQQTHGLEELEQERLILQARGHLGPRLRNFGPD
jgi:hypothetical protein